MPTINNKGMAKAAAESLMSQSRFKSESPSRGWDRFSSESRSVSCNHHSESMRHLDRSFETSKKEIQGVEKKHALELGSLEPVHRRFEALKAQFQNQKRVTSDMLHVMQMRSVVVVSRHL